MPKIYKNINVYDAAIERFQTVLREFDNYYVSVSGGKDSSIMLQLMAKEAYILTWRRSMRQQSSTSTS